MYIRLNDKRYVVITMVVAFILLTGTGFVLKDDIIEWLIIKNDDDPQITPFMGIRIIGDVLVFVIDNSWTISRSGSDQNEDLFRKRVKTHLQKEIFDFPEGVSFAVIFFDGSIRTFPSTEHLASAGRGTAEAAFVFIEDMQAGKRENFCFQEAIENGLQLAMKKPWHRKVLVCVGGGDIPGTPSDHDRLLASISQSNRRRVMIHTISHPNASEETQRVLEKIASLNRGTSVRAR